VVPAVVVGFGAGWLRVSRSLLDASVIAAALGLLGWQVLVEPQLVGEADLASWVGIAYPLLGVVSIVVVAVLGYGGHRQLPLSAAVVAVAVLVRAATDVLFTWVVVLREYVPGGWIDLGWQAEAVLLALAGLVAVRHGEAAAPGGLRRDGALPLLLAGALVTTGVTFLDARSGTLSLSTGLLALFTLGAVATRLVLTVHEKELAARRLQEALAEQERLAITDGLTGLHNRRFVEEVLRLEAERCTRSGRPLSLVVLDADHFKRVNDTHGHPVGDVVLREIAQRLASCARPSDVVARYGGEEFVVLLPEVDSEGALEIAERCRQAVRATPVLVEGRTVAMSVSLGRRLPAGARPGRRVAAAAGRPEPLPGQGPRPGPGAGRALPRTGRERARRPASEAVAFLCALADRARRAQSPSEHAAAVGRWSAAVAESLGPGRPGPDRLLLGAAGCTTWGKPAGAGAGADQARTARRRGVVAGPSAPAQRRRPAPPAAGHRADRVDRRPAPRAGGRRWLPRRADHRPDPDRGEDRRRLRRVRRDARRPGPRRAAVAGRRPPRAAGRGGHPVGRPGRRGLRPPAGRRCGPAAAAGGAPAGQPAEHQRPLTHGLAHRCRTAAAPLPHR
jgi:diguanylate cyclase (GGDEF)-like protein